MQGEFIVHENTTPLPTIHVVSDSVGLTAQAMARAAAAQFGVTNPNIEVLPHVRSFEEVKQFIAEHGELHKRLCGDENLLIFYTLVDGDLRRTLSDYCESLPNVVAVDLMTDAMNAIAKLSGQTPSKRPGGLHVADQHYFRRIEAIEFTIAHDDGRNPQEMSQADIVLLGVSRSSKTPTSIYLAQQGYKVSNIPLDSLHRAAPRGVRRRSHAPVRLDDHRRCFGGYPTAPPGKRCRGRLEVRRPRVRLRGPRSAPVRLCGNWGPSSFTPKIAPLRKPLKRFYGTTNGRTRKVLI